MTLEQVNALVTILDLSNIVKDGMCLSEPIMCKYDNTWIDVFFTYGINYDEEKYSGPISVFGIDSELKKVVFTKTGAEYNFPISSEVEVDAYDWDEEGARFYDAYAESYEKLREKLLDGINDDSTVIAVKDYVDLIKNYTDGSLWDVYSVLLKDIYEFLK